MSGEQDKLPAEKEAAEDRGDGAGSERRASFVPRAIVPPRLAFLLATLTGVLTALGFAGADIWPLSLVGFVPLIVALKNQPVARATKLGLWAGFVEVMIGFYWLTGMLQTFSGFPLPLCVLFASLLSAYQAGQIGLVAWLYARTATRGRLHHGLCFAGAFAAGELVWPLLFPWHYGAALHRQLLLIQTADLLGPIAVTLVVIAANLVIAELVQKVREQDFDKRTVIGGLGFVLATVAYGAVRIPQVEAAAKAGEAVKVGLAQAHIPLKGRSRAVRDSLRLTDELKKQGAQLVVWSEAAINQAFAEETHQASLKRTVTRRLGVPAVVGGVLYRRLTQPGPKQRKLELFNSAFMVDVQGNVTGRYDKQFLLMFGEYLPLGDLFPILYRWSPNSGAFTPGTSFESMKHGEHRIAAMICYEDIIPSFVNKLVATGDPDLLVNLTNDSWFGDSWEPWQHYALAKLRSVEQRLYLARVSNSGVSAIVDATGGVVVEGGTFRQQALVGEARYMRLRTLYSRIGNLPWWIVAAAMGALSFVRPRERSRG